MNNPDSSSDTEIFEESNLYHNYPAIKILNIVTVLTRESCNVHFIAPHHKSKNKGRVKDKRYTFYNPLSTICCGQNLLISFYIPRIIFGSAYFTRSIAKFRNKLNILYTIISGYCSRMHCGYLYSHCLQS